MYTHDLPTSLPAPKGVIISWSPSLDTGASRLLSDGGCPTEAILSLHKNHKKWDHFNYKTQKKSLLLNNNSLN